VVTIGTGSRPVCQETRHHGYDRRQYFGASATRPSYQILRNSCDTLLHPVEVWRYSVTNEDMVHEALDWTIALALAFASWTMLLQSFQ